MVTREDRAGVQRALATIRPLLSQGKVWLFLGEGASSLPNGVNCWWDYLSGCLDSTQACNEEFRKLEQAAMSSTTHMYLYNTLRMVARWPGAVTLNPDQLIEKLLWKGDSDFERVRLDQLAQLPDSNLWLHSDRKLLIKAYGDSGLVTSFQPALKSLLTSPSAEVASALHLLFNTHSFLFLGVDTVTYEDFFVNFIHRAKVPHYMLQRRTPTHLLQSGQLLTLFSELELWEFVMYLSPGNMPRELIPSQVYERCYLATQREEYLQQQLHLETQAAEIAFHTMQVTNALATLEELKATALPKLHDIFLKDPIGSYSEEGVAKAFHAMLGRRQNLLQIIDAGLIPVKSLFVYEEFLRELELGNQESRQMAVRKYADVLLRSRSILRPNSTLELYVLEGLSDSEFQSIKTETFAHIKLQGGEDEAVCYAEPACPGKKKLQTHLVVVNGSEVANKRRVFERSLAKAWNPRESLLRLAAKVVEVDRVVDALDAATRYQLESLHSVVVMLDRSIDAKSLVYLGGGSFGDVYKAMWNGRTVALKFLKDAARPEDINNFKTEFQRLRQAEHDNVVKVFKLTVENNRLGLIMEFVDGGNVRQLLLDRGPQPPEIAYRCALQVASAILHLHSHNVVHRDIKTDNILVSKDLSVFKLADFGLARVVEQTEQYNTIKGTYRYMAPEILRGHDGAAKYSVKVDVYSYGLVLLEVVTGYQVFQDLSKDELESGKRDGRLTPSIPATCEEVYGPVIATIIRNSVASAERRPNMSVIVQMLHDNQVLPDLKADIKGCSILCLGTGKGATTLLRGEPSSSFLLMQENNPILLVDLGLGITYSYKKSTGTLLTPPQIYITHNHADHAAELPVLLCVLEEMRRSDHTICKPSILAAKDVMHRLKTQRIPEVCHNNVTQDDLAEWKVCDSSAIPTSVDAEGEFQLSAICSRHSEVCYGFMLYQWGCPLLAYSGDSGYDAHLYNHLFAAPNVILDARTKSTQEHAGFVDVRNYMDRLMKNQDQKVFITGYGVECEYPEDGVRNAIQLQTGQMFSLLPPNGREQVERTSLTVGYVPTIEALSP